MFALVFSVCSVSSVVKTQIAPPDEVTLRVIVVDSADKAQRVVTRLNGGENFMALARAESIDPTATAGGFLGKVTLSTLPAVLKDALVGVGSRAIERGDPDPDGICHPEGRGRHRSRQ